MTRKIISWILGISLISLLFAFHLLKNLLYQENASIYKASGKRHTSVSGDYIGLLGEAVNFPFQCNICALVGTSGHLLRSGLGEEIDEKHSCIFRLGFSPTRGYEQDVGFRTTARIVDSFRFYPFLKKPSKLIAGPYTSEFWFVFDRSLGDITNFHSKNLGGLLQKHDSQFLWFSRKLERKVHSSLSGNKLRNRGKSISSLWFTTQVIEDAGCKELNIYAIPDGRICKRNLNFPLQSMYWDRRYGDLCSNGIDASLMSINSSAPIPPLPTVVERLSLMKWAEQQFSKFNFKAPSWDS